MSQMDVQTFRWDIQRYLDVALDGVLSNEKVELIDGKIVLMPAQNEPHALSVSMVTRELMSRFPPPYWVKIQSTYRLGKYFAPEPDVMLLPRMHDKGRDFHDLPLLVVEVAETSLRYDRGAKASMYASRGVSDYWVVNLIDDQVEVFRQPVTDESAEFKWRYAPPLIFRRGQSVQLLARPEHSIIVDTILP